MTYKDKAEDILECLISGSDNFSRLSELESDELRDSIASSLAEIVEGRYIDDRYYAWKNILTSSKRVLMHIEEQLIDE